MLKLVFFGLRSVGDAIAGRPNRGLEAKFGRRDGNELQSFAALPPRRPHFRTAWTNYKRSRGFGAKKKMLDATRSPKVAPDVRRKRVTPHQAKSCAAEYKWKCARCGKMLGADFQIDNIVPLHLGGEHCISNMQPLHPHCHATKNSEEQMAARR